MADTQNMPSSDRDIEFCEKAIQAGYIVKEIVPSILRKLNEKRISGMQSSIGQELIALDIMSREQVKEILLMLENVELTCENCGKRYAIRAYDPGRQYACKECGAYLEPADADMRMLKRDNQLESSDHDQNSSSSIGDPNPQLADLLPPEEQADSDDPILSAAKPGSLQSKGLVGKDVFALDDDMLGEMQQGDKVDESDELNRILGIEPDERPKPVEKPSIARERKIAADKFKEETKRRPISERRKIQSGDILQELQEEEIGDDDDFDPYAKQNDELRPLGLQDLSEESTDFENQDVEISGNKLMNQSEFLRMIDPEAKKNQEMQKKKEEKVEKGEIKKAKKEKKQKHKDKKFEKTKRDYKKYKQPYSKQKSSEKSGINFLSIGLFILLLIALISAFMMFKLWSDKKKEVENLNDKIQKSNQTIRELRTQIADIDIKPNNVIVPDEGSKLLRSYENEYLETPTTTKAKEIAEKIKSELVDTNPVFMVNFAEYYQNAGLADEALIILKDFLEKSKLSTSVQVKISLKIAELTVFNIKTDDLSGAIEYIEKALDLGGLTTDDYRLLQTWDAALKGKYFNVLKFNTHNSFETNITYLLDQFAGLIPNLKSKFKSPSVSSNAQKALQKALLLYENNYSVELVGCLSVFESGNKALSITKFNDFQKRFGYNEYMQTALAELYFAQKDYKKAEKVLSWLINQKKNLQDNEKRRDPKYQNLLTKRAETNSMIPDYPSAISDYKDLIELYPADALKYRVKLGKLYLDFGNNIEASDQLTTAYKLSKTKEITELFLTALLRVNRLNSAKEMLDDVMNDAKYKDDCNFIVLQGLFYLKRKNSERAFEEFNRALQNDANCIDALYYKAKLELEQNHYDSAKILIDRLGEIDNQLWKYYFLTGIYMQKKKPEDANTYLKMAKDAAPPAFSSEIQSYIIK